MADPITATIMTLKVLGKVAAKKIATATAKGMAKKAVKGAVKRGAKRAVKSVLKKKKVKGKDIAKKMFGGGDDGGGALVASPSGSLVGSPGGALAPTTPGAGGDIVKVSGSAANDLGLAPFMDSLTAIQVSVDDIKAVINDNNKDATKRLEKQRLENAKLAKEDREAALEGKKGGLGKKLMKPGKDAAEGFLSRMAKFFAMTLLGSLVNALLGGARDIIFAFRVGVELLKKGMPALLRGVNFLKKGVGKSFKLIISPFKALGNLVLKGLKGLGDAVFNWVGGIVGKIKNGLKNALQAAMKSFANAFPKIANLASKGKEMIGGFLQKGKDIVGNVVNKGKNLVKNIGSKVTKTFSKVGGKVSKFVSKLFGKNAAKAVAGPAGKTIFKSLAKGAKAIRIPIIGPLLVAITSMLSGNPLDQVLFKTMGAAIGGGLGLFLGPIGMFVGEIIGEFIGDVLYEGFRGKGWEAAGQKLKDKFKQILSGGKKVVTWIAGGLGRYIKNIITTDPITIPDGKGLRMVATKTAKFLGLYDWLKKEGFAGGKKGQIDKFPNLLNVLFPWKSTKILIKSFFPPGEEGAKIAKSESSSDAEDVSSSASYEDGGDDDTMVVDGSGDDAGGGGGSSGEGGSKFISLGVDKLSQVNIDMESRVKATLYKI